MPDVAKQQDLLDRFCQPCNRSFVTPFGLQNHLDKAAKHKLSRYCTACNIEFASQTALGHHLCFDPAHAKPLSCRVCAKVYTTETALERHLASQGHITAVEDRFKNIIADAAGQGNCKEDETVPLFPCVRCPKVFKAAFSLENHLRSTGHDTEPVGGTFRCDVCAKEFEFGFALRDHCAVTRHVVGAGIPFRGTAIAGPGPRKQQQPPATNLLHPAPAASTPPSLPLKKRSGNIILGQPAVLGKMTPVRRPECHSCRLVFHAEMDLHTHLASAEHQASAQASLVKYKPGILGCNMCTDMFLNDSDLQRHLVDAHFNAINSQQMMDEPPPGHHKVVVYGLSVKGPPTINHVRNLIDDKDHIYIAEIKEVDIRAGDTPLYAVKFYTEESTLKALENVASKYKVTGARDYKATPLVELLGYHGKEIFERTTEKVIHAQKWQPQDGPTYPPIQSHPSSPAILGGSFTGIELPEARRKCTFCKTVFETRKRMEAHRASCKAKPENFLPPSPLRVRSPPIYIYLNTSTVLTIYVRAGDSQ